jgi:hypothetical protein
MTDGEEWIVLFDSIHFVLAAEKVFRERGLAVDLRPVPRELSADCGMALAVRGRPLEDLAGVLADPRCRPRAVYSLDAGCYREARLG